MAEYTETKLVCFSEEQVQQIERWRREQKSKGLDFSFSGAVRYLAMRTIEKG